MRILISGASGFIGTALQARLVSQGHSIFSLSRRPAPGAGTIAWDPEKNTLESKLPESLDAVIHLAGENIASGLWTAAKRRRIMDSRIKTTRLLCSRILDLKNPPARVLCASAVGYYGDTGQEPAAEASPAGAGFLAEVSQAWEDAAGVLEGKNIAVSFLRFGVVLDRQGGMLARLLPFFNLGLGGRLGAGRQFVSWIAMPDVVRAVDFLLESRISGPVNITSPQPVTNAEFTRTLAEVLHRPACLPVPAGLLKLLLGPLAKEVLLANSRVYPRRLLETGFKFQHPQLREALAALLALKGS